MADHKITDFVDQSAIDGLQRLKQEMQSVRETYVNVATELAKGLKLSVDGIDQLEKTARSYADLQRQAADATQRHSAALEEERQIVGKTTAAIAENLQEVEKQNRAQRQSGVEHDKVKAILEQINGTYDNNLKRLLDVEAQMRRNKTAMTQLSDELKAGKISQEQYDRGVFSLTKSSRELAQEKSRLTSLLKNEEREMASVEGSYNHLSQQLELLKKTYKDLTAEEAASPMGQEMHEAINQLDTELKHLAESMGEHQRNVGDYAIAGQSMRQELSQMVTEIAMLTVQYRDMDEQEQKSAKGQEMQKHIEELTEKAGKLRDAMADTKDAIKNAASDTRGFDQINDGVQLLTSGFGAATGAAEMLGLSEESLESIQTKLQASIAATNALSTIQTKLQKQSALMQGVCAVQTKAAAAAENLKTAATGKGIIATTAATAAQKLFNIVANANPYVLLATALITVVGALWAFTRNSGKAAEEQKKLSRELKKTNDELNGISDKCDFDVAMARAAGKSAAEIRKMRREALKLRQELAIAAEAKISLDPKASKEAKAEAKKMADDAQKAFDDFVNETRVELAAEQREAEEAADAAAKASAEEKKRRYEAAKSIEELNKIEMDARLKTINAELESATEFSDEWIRLRKAAIDTDTDIQLDAVNTTLKANLAAATESYKVGKISQADYLEVCKKLTEEAQKEILAITLNGEKQQADLLKEQAEQQAEERERLSDKAVSDAEAVAAAEQAIRDAKYTEDIAAEKRRYAVALDAAKGDAAERERVTKEYEDNCLAITQAYALDTANAEIDIFQNLLDNEELTEEEREEIARKLAKAKADLNDQIAENTIAAVEAQAEAERKTAEEAQKLHEERLKRAQEWLQAVADGLNQVAAIASAITDGKIEKIEAEQEALDEAASSEQERIEKLADSGAITEEEAEARKRAAQVKTEQKTEELERKKQQLKIKQAKWDKANSLAQVAISTAQAIMSAMAMRPPRPSLAAIAAAMGALQAATIIATPIPKYAKGTKDHPGGYAIVGDAGKSEIVSYGGKMYLTPDKPTLVDMPKGAEVYPDADRLLASNVGIASSAVSPVKDMPTVVVNNDYGELKREIVALGQLIKQQTKAQKSAAHKLEFEQFKALHAL